MVTILLTSLGLLLALLLNQPLRGRTLGRVSVIMPYVISSAVAGVVWKWMYNPNFGIINSYLRQLGFEGFRFLTDATSGHALACVYECMVVGGFQHDYFPGCTSRESPKSSIRLRWWMARMPTRSFRHITVPLLRPIILYVTVLCAANSFQMFDEAYMMTQGGPVGSTVTLVYKTYITAFEAFKFGDAAALSVITMPSSS